MRRVLLSVTGGLLAVVLSGCSLMNLLPQQRPPQTPQTPQTPDGPAAQGPEGWNDLRPCDPSELWVWVEGYPVEEMEAAGLAPTCGGTYFSDDVPTYVSAGDPVVTDDELAALRSNLEASGYVEIATTFQHPQPGDDPGLAGSWQYERNSGNADELEVIYIVNLWDGSDPVVYETFVDYESPATRELSL